jgi:hypothetical protein
MADDDKPGTVLSFTVPVPPQEPAPLVLDPDKYADVIALDTRRGYTDECQHTMRREVDQHARRIICTGCKRDLDPFQVLHDIAWRYGKKELDWKQLCQDIKRAQALLADLQRQEHNARERLKRLAPKLMKAGVPLEPVSE